MPDLLTPLIETATVALRLKKQEFAYRIRRSAIHHLHIKSVQVAERDLVRALMPVFKRQVESMVSKLGGASKEEMELWTKYNSNHDEHGRFAEGDSGGGGGGGGDQSGEQGRGGSVVDQNGSEITLADKYYVGFSSKNDILHPNDNGVLFLTPLRYAAEMHATMYGKSGYVHEVLKSELKTGSMYKVSALAMDDLASNKSYIAELKQNGHTGMISDDGYTLALFYSVTPNTIESHSKSVLSTKSSAASLAKRIINPKQWTDEIKTAAMPVLAFRMAEAARNQLIQLGVSKRRLKSFGQKYNPNHDELGRFAEGGGTQMAPDTGGGTGGGRSESNDGTLVYHSTAVEYAQSIMKNGLRTSSGGRDHPKGVYASTEVAEAFAFGTMAASKEFSTGVNDGRYTYADADNAKVLLIVADKSQFPEVMYPGPEATIFRSPKKVPPSAFNRVEVYNLRAANKFARKYENAKYEGKPLPKMPPPKPIETIYQSTKSDGGDLFLSFGIIEESNSKSFSSTKSTATDWLESQDDLEDLFDELPQWIPGTLPYQIVTELPEAMKQRISESLRESFQQDYWDNISATTQGNAETILEEGLREGWSIRDMAKELRERLGGDDYARTRASNIARTESGNALNGARKDVFDQIQEDLGGKVPMRSEWLSVLSNTTRDTHANLDGVPADDDGLWDLSGYMIPWPAHFSLPPGERCNCMCSVTLELGMEENEAGSLIADYYARQEEMGEEAVRGLQEKHQSSISAVVDDGILVGVLSSYGASATNTAQGGQFLRLLRSFGYDGSKASVAALPPLSQILGSTNWSVGNDVPRMLPCGQLEYGGVKYDPMQPRDETGKWSAGGSGWSKVDIIDVSGWNKQNAAAVSAAKKILMMQKAAAAGDWDTVMSVKIGSKIPNSFQKGVLKAQAKLLANHQAGVDKTPSEMSVDKNGIVDASSWKQVSGSLGTQPGGRFTAADGKDYYAKFPSNENAAVNELLSNKLYAAAGAAVPSAMLITRDGKVGVAAEWLDSKKADWSDPDTKIAAANDFAVHAWTANWDCVGAGGENPMDNLRVIEGDGGLKVAAVDVGGSLFMKGTGVEKSTSAFGETANEWDTLRDAQINPSAAKVFGEMTNQQLIDSAQKVLAVDKTTIDNLCDKYAPLMHVNPSELSATLQARQADLSQRVEALKSHDVAKINDAAPKSATNPDGEKIAVAAVGAHVASPPTINSPVNAPVYQPKFNKLYELASKGDWEGVQNFKTNPDAKQCYAVKLNAYKQSLLEASGTHGTIASVSSLPKVMASPKINESQLPSIPTFKDPKFSAANTAMAKEAMQLAKAGDLDGLKAMNIPGSSKLQSWHTDLMTNVSSQLHPPPPLSHVGKTLEEISSKAAPVVGAAAQKLQSISKYTVIGSADIGNVKINGSWEKQIPWGAGETAYSKLSIQERTAVKSYTGSAYATMNSQLRGFKPLSPSTLAAANAVTKAAIPIEPGTMLSRKHGLVGTEAQIQSLVGKVIQDRGIISTASTSSTWSGDVQMRLTIGPGVRALPAKNFSKISSENEVLLPPNTRYLVTSVVNKVVNAVVLPFHEGQCCPP